MGKECVFGFMPKIDTCNDGQKRKPKPTKLNPATEAKINTVSSYVDAWLQKIINYKKKGEIKYQGVIFMDCMCNSGSYIVPEKYPKGELGKVAEGTSAKVHDSFKRASIQYPQKKFILILNDSEKNQIECQYCRLSINNKNQMLKEYSYSDNYKILFYNQDANKLLKSSEIKQMLINPYHMLLFYDPYVCSIDWNALDWYIKSSKVDIILNHMVSDVIRGIDVSTSEKTKNKYLSTYRMDNFEDLHTLVTNCKSPQDKYELLRKKIKKIVTEIAEKSKVVSAPFFIRNNIVLYDIVLISYSKEATVLFKDTTYKILRERFSNPENEQNRQMNLFELFDIDVDYGALKEYDCYSSVKHFANVVKNHFRDKEVPNYELNRFLDDHDYLPRACKRDLDKELKNFHHVKIIQKKDSGKIYNFRKE